MSNNTELVVLPAQTLRSDGVNNALMFAFGDNPKANKHHANLVNKMREIEGNDISEDEGSVAELLTKMRDRYISNPNDHLVGHLLNVCNWTLSLHFIKDVSENPSDALDALATSLLIIGDDILRASNNGDELILDFNSFFRQGFMAYQLVDSEISPTKH